MTKDELVNSLQKRDPLLANAVSNMVLHFRPLSCRLPKQGTDGIRQRLPAFSICRR